MAPIYLGFPKKQQQKTRMILCLTAYYFATSETQRKVEKFAIADKVHFLNFDSNLLCMSQYIFSIFSFFFLEQEVDVWLINNLR